jgi:hypothetical protein
MRGIMSMLCIRITLGFYFCPGIKRNIQGLGFGLLKYAVFSTSSNFAFCLVFA